MKITTYIPTQSLIRKYGYSIKSLIKQDWIIGPNNTFGWYRLKKDCQTRCNELNKEK